MKLYTSRLDYDGNKVEDSMDITIKSGIEMFAPNWLMVARLKKGNLSKENFDQQYRFIMKRRIKARPEIFKEILELDEFVIKCYCLAGEFCHRYLFTSILKDLAEFWALPFEYIGEIDSDDNVIIDGDKILSKVEEGDWD
jgi:hypothetical protein